MKIKVSACIGKIGTGVEVIIDNPEIKTIEEFMEIYSEDDIKEMALDELGFEYYWEVVEK